MSSKKNWALPIRFVGLKIVQYSCCVFLQDYSDYLDLFGERVPDTLDKQTENRFKIPFAASSTNASLTNPIRSAAATVHATETKMNCFGTHRSPSHLPPLSNLLSSVAASLAPIGVPAAVPVSMVSPNVVPIPAHPVQPPSTASVSPAALSSQVPEPKVVVVSIPTLAPTSTTVPVTTATVAAPALPVTTATPAAVPVAVSASSSGSVATVPKMEEKQEFAQVIKLMDAIGVPPLSPPNYEEAIQFMRSMVCGWKLFGVFCSYFIRLFG